MLARGNEKRSVKVQPYGSEYVKVLEGLEGGEVLIQQTTPKRSGMNRNRNGSGSQKNSGNSRGSAGFPGGGFPGGPGPM